MPPPSERLLVPSALLSSRWSRDSLITPEMARLYTGAVTARLGVGELESHLRTLSGRWGPIEVLTGSLGVLSWNIRCARGAGQSLLLLPLGSDEPGVGGRSKRSVPERCFQNAQHFAARGLDRYLLQPEQLLELQGTGPCASFVLPPGHSALTFGLGSARVDLVDDAGAWVVRLGAEATGQALRELVRVLAYHYDESDGSAIADVLVNDGDFLLRRQTDGGFALRLSCARRVERGIEPNRFLLYLLQLMAYEDWSIGEDLVGLPVAISEPLLAFSGFVAGTAQRALDLGRTWQAGADAARAAIERFGRSRDGRAYFPWVRRFLLGAELDAEHDSRRPWWNLTELEERRELLRLRQGEAAARPLGALIEQLEARVGVGTFDTASTLLLVNDLDRGQVLNLLEAQRIDAGARDPLTEAWFAGWPYRDLGQLAAHVPGLFAGAPLPDLSFAVSPAQEEGSLAALEVLPARRPQRTLANPEIYGQVRIDPRLALEATAVLPSFEEFMDDVLHDPRFGYYAHRVAIGRGGHFSTHPEDLSPHYGRFLATWALGVRRQLIEAGRLSEQDAFPLIEFGAGNGRWARDCIDAVRSRSQSDAEWRSLAASLDYRIYELSDSLRSKQAALLGADARVLAGDAREPAQALTRDFPRGVTGLIVSNELPDAFGVHKVLLTAEGDAQAVLVVPRIDSELLERLPAALRADCRAADAALRKRLSLTAHPAQTQLDRATFRRVMTLLYAGPESERALGIDQIWFEEILVPADAIGPLARVLRQGAAEYGQALAEEQSGVVTYVNVHGVTFLSQLAGALACGQILTIDYGDTTQGLVRGARRGKFPLRIYCDEGDYAPRPNDPYTRPGAQDLTADVNFTDLALAGLQAGLDLHYYGPERALAGPEWPRVLASTDQQPLAHFAANPIFKLLALGRGLVWPSAAAGLEPLGLFTDAGRVDAELFDAERASRRAAIQSRLERLSAGRPA